MKYGFIEAERGNFAVRSMCSALRVQEKGYYRWRKRKNQPDHRIGKNESELRVAIADLHRRSNGTYGRPRLLEELRKRGFSVGGNRVRRIMLEMGLAGRSGRRRTRRPHTRPSGEPPAPNLLARNFNPVAPNAVWAGDLTQLQAGDRTLWMAVVIDLYSRRVVGWGLGESANAGLVARAMADAVRLRRPRRGLIFHSDQGAQYASERIQTQLRFLRVQQSMSRRGNCWDNAPVESFFATLKKELIHAAAWSSRAELARALDRYVRFYNDERLHSTLDYRSPAEFEARAKGSALAA